MFSEFTDVVPSFFGWLNQGPMTLTTYFYMACDSYTYVLDI